MPKFEATKTPEQRIRARSTEDACGCWNWNSARPDGRANVFFFGGKYVSAYRASYRIFVGDIPDGMQVLHKCDNPLCVNPEHLFIGNQADNMADMRKKGRRASFAGSAHGMAKLDESLARQIISEYVPRKVTLKQLATKFGVSVATIHRVVLGKGWAHITQP